MTKTFSSLRIRNFRLYFAGMNVAATGTWMMRVAQSWLVLRLTDGSGTALGVMTGLQFLPLPLVGSWAGVLADRYPKRRLLFFTQMAMGSCALVLGVLDITGVVTLWQVFVLAFLFGTASSVDQPARLSFVIEMVGEDELSNAVALNSSSFNAARLVGPALAGVLITAVGTGWVILLYAVSVIAVIAALAGMRTAELHPVSLAARAPGQFREGLAYVRRRPELLLVFVVIGFVGAFGLTLETTIPLMARDVFHGNAAQYGLFTSVLAIGSFTGALLAARRGRPRLRLFAGATIAFGALSITAASMPYLPLFVIVLVPLGLANLTAITAANAYVQLTVDPAMRGRVMALYMTTMLGGAPIGGPVVGWLAEVAGPRAGMMFAGAVTAAAAVLASLVLVRSRGLVVRPALKPRPRLDIRPAPTHTGAGDA